MISASSSTRSSTPAWLQAARSSPEGSWHDCVRADASRHPIRRDARGSARSGIAAPLCRREPRAVKPADMIEVQMAGEHDLDVVRRVTRHRRAHGRGDSCVRDRRSRRSWHPVLSPQPASMSSVCSPRTISGRIPSVMRLRSSGGERALPERRAARRRTSRRRRGERTHRTSVMSSRSPQPKPQGRAQDGSPAGRSLFQLDQHAVRR